MFYPLFYFIKADNVKNTNLFYENILAQSDQFVFSLIALLLNDTHITSTNQVNVSQFFENSNILCIKKLQKKTFFFYNKNPVYIFFK